MYDPAHPFGRKRYSRAVIDPVSCTGCGYCTMFCVMDCILLQPDGFYTARCAHILQNGEISPEEFQIQANALLENLIKENAT